MKCFVDTSGIVALYAANDDRHDEASAIWSQMLKENAVLYTIRDCIAETIILMRRREGYQAALICGNDLWASSVLEVLRPTLDDDLQAWELFKKYSDKALSFVDCLSFVMMRNFRIHDVFTFGEDFSRLGFNQISA